MIKRLRSITNENCELNITLSDVGGNHADDGGITDTGLENVLKNQDRSLLRIDVNKMGR